MNELTTLERRALSRLTTPGGGMLIVAADQRNSMKKVMTDDPQTVDRAGLAAAKADLVSHLGNRAPAILLDPETALPEIVDDGVIAPETGLVVALDASGFAETDEGLRRTRYIDGMSPRRVRELGGDAAKMLFYLRPDQGAAEDEVITAIRDLVAAANDEGVLLIVEILTYRLPGESEDEYAAAFGGLIEQATRICVEQGVKVLKIPYPGSAEASDAVHAAAQGVPWAVLSAGVDHATFVGQVRTAVRHGSAGAMAGRSLWKDCLSTSADEREQRLTGVAAVRAAELAEVIDEELAAR
ncbi:tagatose-bisphosphate aldolase [Microbacterium halotolerans]|uniref:tagatose-bisphosphate aldolase n=1 Tax=Microbacterium halotolerans TaxID=246613 RepID=UPI000E6AB007|nr:tagatose-bisphosphate aldolase [Microbacterium halotolerans]